MSITRRASSMASGVLTTTVALLLAGSGAAQAAGGTIYDSIPAPLPPNVASLGFEATSTSEFGDRIAFAPPAPVTFSL